MVNTVPSLKYLFIAILLLMTYQVTAQDHTSGIFRFLYIPSTPYSGSLAVPANSLPVKTLSLIHNNPAYLDSSDHKAVNFSYTHYFADISLTEGSVGWHTKSGMFAASIRFMGYGDFQKRDELGADQGNFTAYDMALGIHHSTYLSTAINWGLSSYFIYSTIDDARSSGIVLSTGLNYIIDEHYSLGITLLNAGIQITQFADKKEQIPYMLNAGFTHRLKHMPFRYSITLQRLNDWDLKTIYDNSSPDIKTNLMRHLGLSGEFLFTDNFNFRFGYNHLMNESLRTESRIDFSGTSFGIGINTGFVIVDFSRSSFSSLGAVYQLAIKKTFK